jgi:hypothetical protein
MIALLHQYDCMYPHSPINIWSILPKLSAEKRTPKYVEAYVSIAKIIVCYSRNPADLLNESLKKLHLCILEHEVFLKEKPTIVMIPKFCEFYNEGATQPIHSVNLRTLMEQHYRGEHSESKPFYDEVDNLLTEITYDLSSSFLFKRWDLIVAKAKEKNIFNNSILIN